MTKTLSELSTLLVGKDMVEAKELAYNEGYTIRIFEHDPSNVIFPSYYDFNESRINVTTFANTILTVDYLG